MNKETTPKPQITRRSFLRGAFGIVAGGLGVATIAGCKPGEQSSPSTSTTRTTESLPSTTSLPGTTVTSEVPTSGKPSTTVESTTVPETTVPEYIPTNNPEVQVDGSLLYKIKNEPSIGGFIMNYQGKNGEKIGFTDPIEGPALLYGQVLTAIQAQRNTTPSGVRGEAPTKEQLDALREEVRANNGWVRGLQYPVLDNPKYQQYNSVPTDNPHIIGKVADLNLSLPIDFISVPAIPKELKDAVLTIGQIDIRQAIVITADGRLQFYTDLPFEAVSYLDGSPAESNILIPLETFARTPTCQNSETWADAVINSVGVDNVNGRYGEPVLDRAVFYKIKADNSGYEYSLTKVVR